MTANCPLPNRRNPTTPFSDDEKALHERGAIIDLVRMIEASVRAGKPTAVLVGVVVDGEIRSASFGSSDARSAALLHLHLMARLTEEQERADQRHVPPPDGAGTRTSSPTGFTQSGHRESGS